MPSRVGRYMFAKHGGQVFGATSSAASSCPKGGAHHFQGYPRERSACKRCGTRKKGVEVKLFED